MRGRCVFFIAGWFVGCRVIGLGLRERVFSGHRPRRSWSGGSKRAGEQADESGIRANGGEGDAHAMGGLDDAGAELQQAQAEVDPGFGTRGLSGAAF